MDPDELAARTAARADDDTDRYGPYSNTDMHLAQLIDEIRWLRFAVYQAASGKPQQPTPYPRPGVRSGRRRLAPEQQNYLLRLKAQRERQAPQVPVPAHIAAAAARKLGPGEQHWLRTQLHSQD